MRKILLTSLYIYISFILLFSPMASASTLSGSIGEKVQAQVGEYYLNLSGFMSPYASIVLTINGIFVRATVADAGGNFYISNVLINAGLSQFCLEAVDFKKIGDSYTCINIPPATGSVTKKNIFLPPTLGLSRNSVAAGGTVLAFGYTMPNALVTLNLGNGKTQTVLADSTGYYIFTLKNIPAGTYNLFATARYNNQDSLAPSKTLQLKALPWWQQIIELIKRFIAWLMNLLTSIGLGPLWLGLPVLILIIILILKLWPDRFTFIYENQLIFFLEKRRKPHHLHHYWEFDE